jgi:hypothetical protein
LSSTGAAFDVAGGLAAADGASSAPRRPHPLNDAAKLNARIAITIMRFMGNPVIQFSSYSLK